MSMAGIVAARPRAWRGAHPGRSAAQLLDVGPRGPRGHQELGDPEVEDPVKVLGELDQCVVACRVVRQVDALSLEKQLVSSK